MNDPLVSAPSSPVTRQLAAKMILEAKAVQFSAEDPFFLTSGWASPVYVDCQRLISFPRIRTCITQLATQAVITEIGFEQFDGVVGAESAGIAYAAWIADRLFLPLQYIRRRRRGLQAAGQIEGVLRPGARVLLIDDISTDGLTKLDLCKVIRALNLHIAHIFVIFFYDLFPEARAQFERLGIRIHYLTTWHDILSEGASSGYFEPSATAEIRRFLSAPDRWSIEHGGIGSFPAHQ